MRGDTRDPDIIGAGLGALGWVLGRRVGVGGATCGRTKRPPGTRRCPTRLLFPCFFLNPAPLGALSLTWSFSCKAPAEGVLLTRLPRKAPTFGPCVIPDLDHNHSQAWSRYHRVRRKLGGIVGKSLDPTWGDSGFPSQEEIEWNIYEGQKGL